MVILAEVMRKNFLASIVPVIVNAVLNAHQLVPDLVAFVANGDFPRSRLGEKQRGKILAGWVTRKIRTIAQFGIRDPDALAEKRNSVSFRNSSIRGSSLRHVESASAIDDLKDYAPLPTGISELPADYDSSIMESPPTEEGQPQQDAETPTGTNSGPKYPLAYSPLALPKGDYFDGELFEAGDGMRTPQPQEQERTSYLEAPELSGGFGFDNQLSSHQPVANVGGLRVSNASPPEDEHDWPQEAMDYYGKGRQ